MSAIIPQEVVLSTLPGGSENDRLQIVLRTHFSSGEPLQLRQQTWGEGVGWYTQSTISLTSEQAAALRNSLGGAPSRMRPENPNLRICRISAAS